MKPKIARRFIKRNLWKATRFSFDKKDVPRLWFWGRWDRAMNVLRAVNFKGKEEVI